ncbi:transposase [Lewinella aquimaris]|uniref:Transposase n=1 Tax=Neolewinella aquimaris TaxID=1835722 RepID=A0A840E859_9BACT|nr:transposase [Neolewinella aquimaris]MBB4077979.1 transposase [Neolewinella aquimaris]
MLSTIMSTSSFECPVRDPAQRGFVVEAQLWVVERTFGWSNRYRRIIKDYERTEENSTGFVLLANMQLVLLSIANLSP